jgi:hypothetical protein
MPVASLDGLFALIVCLSLAGISWLAYVFVRGRTGSELF